MKSTNLEAISPWLQMLWEQGGSDLLLTGGSEPRLRVDGKLCSIAGVGKMSAEEVDNIVRSMLDSSQVDIFEQEQDVDFSFSWEDKARLRANAFTQKGNTAARAADDPELHTHFRPTWTSSRRRLVGRPAAGSFF